MRICMICVCHNTHKEFDNYYLSIQRADINFSSDVVLLDNSETVSEDQVDRYRSLSESNKRFFYKRVKNLGYLGSAQRFLQSSLIDFSVYDFLCISNVDLILTKDFFVNLESAAAEIRDDVGMIAPKIITADNINKNPKIINRPTQKNLLIRKFLFSSYVTHFFLEKMHLLRKHISRHKEREKKFRKFEKIYAAHGSFFLFLKPAFDVVIQNIYPVFLFGEEIFLAELMERNDLITCYMHNLVIHDFEHASTGKMKSASYRKHNSTALRYIIDTFYR